MSDINSPYGPITFVEDDADLRRFFDWLRVTDTLSIDTETTGLDIFSPAFNVRLVQFGDATHAWLFDVQRWKWDIQGICHDIAYDGKQVIMHNAPYDLLVLARTGLSPLHGFDNLVDTRILAHLHDPRGREDGGIGHSLKNLSAHYVDEQAPDGQQDLKALFKDNGWDWSTVPVKHPTMVLYSGIDVQLTTRLFNVLSQLTADQQQLVQFEHSVMRACVRMQQRGVRVDTAYSQTLLPYFADEARAGDETAEMWGIEKVGSPAQVAAVLSALGVKLTETTPSGNPKVDKEVLRSIVENDSGPAAEVAAAVLASKNAKKLSATYVEKVLASLDADDRCHPFISSLQARTARMSISNPPLQQLPSNDWRIRRMFIPDEGKSMFAVDYSQIELRVLAVLANEQRMIDAINGGSDLHDVTATALFGVDFTKAQRKLAKNVGFGRVYGGGATTLSRQAGVSLEDAQRAMRGYDEAFPGIKRYSRRLQDRAAAGEPVVVTPAGRRLPLDRWRLYAATNYIVQSTARDVLADAILNIEAAGMGEHLLLPIHDEVVCQAPTEDVADIAHAISETMTASFGAVTLTTDTEVFGANWGNGYGAPSSPEEGTS